jgi:hypothetical protein
MGGVILHELCHAFHDVCVAGGWDHEGWRACFAAAMGRGALDAVRVHGPQGWAERGRPSGGSSSAAPAAARAASGAAAAAEAAPLAAVAAADARRLGGQGRRLRSGGAYAAAAAVGPVVPYSAASPGAAAVPTTGPVRRKHYACANPMEFFAELSVAHFEPSSAREYNKWEPFNRPQLEAALPDAAALLATLWESAEGETGRRRRHGGALKVARVEAQANLRAHGLRPQVLVQWPQRSQTWDHGPHPGHS